jgi:transposase-like protein
MPQNRIQFQPGLSMREFYARYGTEEACEQALGEARWAAGFVCPRCEGTSAWSSRRSSQPYRLCSGCGYQCSLTAGTVMHNTKLPLTVWFLAMQLISQAKNGVSALELRRQLDVSYPTAWLLKHKLMHSMHLAEQDRQLHSRIEMDDAFLGGERSGGKPGRGSENKVPFVVAVQTIGNNKPHRVCLAAIPHRTTAVAEFCAKHFVRPATILTDGLACFGAAEHAGVHTPVVTGGGRASAQDPRFQGVNIYLGNLKSALSGTYRAFAFGKYAHRYFAEFQFRFNRREDLHAIFGLMLAAVVTAPPAPSRFIRQVETRC